MTPFSSTNPREKRSPLRWSRSFHWRSSSRSRHQPFPDFWTFGWVMASLSQSCLRWVKVPATDVADSPPHGGFGRRELVCWSAFITLVHPRPRYLVFLAPMSGVVFCRCGWPHGR